MFVKDNVLFPNTPATTKLTKTKTVALIIILSVSGNSYNLLAGAGKSLEYRDICFKTLFSHSKFYC